MVRASICLAAVVVVVAVAEVGTVQAGEFDERPAISWAGGYAGLSVGANGFGTEIDVPGAAKAELDSGSVGLGAFAGYNFQNGPWVWGVEADAFGFGGDDTKSHGVLGDVTAKSNWAGSVRLRGGYAFERLFVYATAGLAIADLELKASNGGNDDGVHAGLALGLGAEAKLGGNWIGRVEAISYGFRFEDHLLAGTKSDVDFGVGTVRLGLGYQF